MRKYGSSIEAYKYYMENEVSKTEAGGRYNLGKSAIGQLMKRKGLEDKIRSKEITKPVVSRNNSLSKIAYSLLQEGKTLEEVKEKTGRTSGMLRGYIKYNNLEELEEVKAKTEYNTPKTKEAYEWKNEFGETYAEASLKFGVTVGAIKSYKYRLAKNSKNKNVDILN